MGYVNHPARLRLLPRSAEAIRRLNRAGVAAVMVTNQAGIARGYFSEDVLRAVNESLVAQLARADARLDGLYVCTHHPSEGRPPFRADCECRKPKPGLLLRAAADLGLDLARSTMVGDKPSDLVPARTVGAGGGPGPHRLRAGRVGIPARRVRGGAGPRRRRSAGRGGLGAGAASGGGVSDLARRLTAVVDAMRARTVLVVGDLIVDEYLFGKPVSHLARGAGADPALHRARGVARWRGQRRAQRARAGRAGRADRRGGPRCGGRRAPRLARRRRHPDRRHRHRGRAGHAGEDADQRRRLPGDPPASRSAGPRAQRRSAAGDRGRAGGAARRAGQWGGRHPRLRLRLRHGDAARVRARARARRAQRARC